MLQKATNCMQAVSLRWIDSKSQGTFSCTLDGHILLRVKLHQGLYIYLKHYLFNLRNVSHVWFEIKKHLLVRLFVNKHLFFPRMFLLAFLSESVLRSLLTIWKRSITKPVYSFVSDWDIFWIYYLNNHNIFVWNTIVIMVECRRK